jgi:hypothetical protein
VPATRRGPVVEVLSESDNFYADGCSLELAKVTGDNAAGYVATLNVPVRASGGPA